MGDLLRFPGKYSGNMLDSLIDSACETVTAQYSKPLGLQLRCIFDVPVIGDPTGVMGQPCNAPAYMICKHCGPICINCKEELHCAGPTGQHEEETDDCA